MHLKLLFYKLFFQDPLERVEQEDLKDHLGVMDSQVLLVQEVPLEYQVHLVTLELRDLKVQEVVQDQEVKYFYLF